MRVWMGHHQSIYREQDRLILFLFEYKYDQVSILTENSLKLAVKMDITDDVS